MLYNCMSALSNILFDFFRACFEYQRRLWTWTFQQYETVEEMRCILHKEICESFGRQGGMLSVRSRCPPRGFELSISLESSDYVPGGGVRFSEGSLEARPEGCLSSLASVPVLRNASRCPLPGLSSVPPLPTAGSLHRLRLLGCGSK